MSRSHRFAICSALVVATAFIDAGAAAADASNDRVAEAQVVQALPATIGGSTEGAAISKGEPSLSCTRAKAILWYSLKAPRRGPMVVRLNAGSKLDAAVAVYRVVRNRRTRVACRRTDVHGRAHLAWYGYSDGSYLIAVARRAQSENGPYK